MASWGSMKQSGIVTPAGSGTADTPHCRWPCGRHFRAYIALAGSGAGSVTEPTQAGRAGVAGSQPEGAAAPLQHVIVGALGREPELRALPGPPVGEGQLERRHGNGHRLG